MLRFLVLALTLLVLTMAAFAFAADHLAPPPAGVGVDFSFAADGMSPRLVLAAWLLEAMALTALFLLVQGRAGSWWLDGLAAGWLGWIFRGPLLVLTVAAATRLAPQPFWGMALRWFVLYTLCGLLLAALARRLGIRR